MRFIGLYNVHILNTTTTSEDLKMKAPKIIGYDMNDLSQVSYSAVTDGKIMPTDGKLQLLKEVEHTVKFSTPEGYIIKEVVMVKIDE